MDNELISFLKKYDISDSSNVYIVAFSGGYDSMFLLDNLKKTVQNKIVAIHLNHNWRKHECDIEELNCKNFCQKIGVEFYCEKLSSDIPHTETAAREARYKFFEKCAAKFNSNVVFTAHNKNDNVETVLYRIMKGTGINGLCGIREHRGIFYRPMLNISRDFIEDYCNKNNLCPNIDSSNSNIKYKRNFLRHEILPKLLEEFPNATNSIHMLSEVADEETEIINKYLISILNEITIDNKYSTKKYLNLSKALQIKIIYDIFQKFNFDYDRKTILKINNVIHEFSNSKSGKKYSINNVYFIFVNSDYFEIIKNDTDINKFNIEITKEGSYSIENFTFEISKFEEEIKNFPKDDEYYAYIDLKNIPFKFSLRTRNDGDIINPLGMNGSQKLKKFLISKHIPNHIKDDLILLAQGKEILWVPGYGLSEKIKVTNKPTHIVKLYIN